MPGFRNFVVAGAGNIGKPIVDALLAKKSEGVVDSVTILTRSEGRYDDLVSKGAVTLVVSYEDVISLTSALTCVKPDVVISAINRFALRGEAQNTLIRASRDAGVKIFVPDEFGNPTDGATEGWFALKDKAKALLEELGLPYTVYYTGPFPDYAFRPAFARALGIDLAQGTAEVIGAGETPISWTTSTDVGCFVAYTLTSLPHSQLKWRKFRIEGESASWNTIFSSYVSATGRELRITHVPRAEVESESASENEQENFAVKLALAWDLGRGSVSAGNPDVVDNKVWPEWKPKKVLDTILEMYKDL